MHLAELVDYQIDAHLWTLKHVYVNFRSEFLAKNTQL